MSEIIPQDIHYERSPVTNRSANSLAHKYGYADLSDLAGSLPEKAKVIDVGAGFSSLGVEVTRLRDDVEWVNADFQYGNFGSTAPNWYNDFYTWLVYHEDRPPNLNYERADATELTDAFGEREFDRVFSYWMLPHIILTDREAGKTAAKKLMDVVKLSGKVSVGPQIKPRLSMNSIRNMAVDVFPSGDEAEHEARADEMVTALAVNPVMGRWKHHYNAAARRKVREVKRFHRKLDIEYRRGGAAS